MRNETYFMTDLLRCIGEVTIDNVGDIFFET